MRIQSGVLALLPLLFAAMQPPATADIPITARMHHLRSGAEREWAVFPEQAEAA
jgi:hypothetical protein